MNKNILRTLLKQKRQVLSSQEREQAANAAAQSFSESALYLSSEKFSVYIATEQELNLSPIVQLLWETGKKVYLPSVYEGGKKQMHFRRYQKDSVLQPNRYNILEPVTDEEISASELEVVLMPLVGFDLQGVRMGTGGGYYDATFSFLQQNPRPLKPQLIGAGFAFQQLPHIPHDTWDVLLDGALTELGLTYF